METDEIKEDGLIISDVSEFVSNLSSTSLFQQPIVRPTAAKTTRVKSEEPEESSLPAAPASEDIKMEDAEDVAPTRSRTRAESEDEGEVEEEEPVKTEAEESSSVGFRRHGMSFWPCDSSVFLFDRDTKPTFHSFYCSIGCILLGGRTFGQSRIGINFGSVETTRCVRERNGGTSPDSQEPIRARSMVGR